MAPRPGPRTAPLALATLLALALPGAGSRGAGIAARPDGPVKVYILSGQSNMVGIGQVSGRSERWSDITEATVSVYPGRYSPDVDYDEIEPIRTEKLAVYGGVHPTPFPGGGVQVSRGLLRIKTSGLYRFSPGYSSSTYNIMELDGVEVYRREVGKEPRHTLFEVTGGKRYRFRITFLTDAANGLGWWERTDIPGTLDTLVRREGKFPHLVDGDGRWTIRRDVWYRGVVTATANRWLSVGCGAGRGQIGPELGFGHVMGDHHDEPVLIIKASQGNRSLGWDFLPPGSPRFTEDGRTWAGYEDTPASWVEGEPRQKVDWYAGKQYDDCFRAVHALLDDFDREFPQFAGRGHEIAGFVWWQGHKDGGNAVHAGRYEENLVRLIRTLRREFEAPDAPFVIATIGFDGWKMKGHQLTVANAQLAVSGDRGKYPDFAKNVRTVETRDFWRDASVSPRNQGFHYNGNAETYLLVGNALGRAMVELVAKRR